MINAYVLKTNDKLIGVQLELLMLMSSQVPVVPLMKDNNILNIKIQTSLCVHTSQVDIWSLTAKI